MSNSENDPVQEKEREIHGAAEESAAAEPEPPLVDAPVTAPGFFDRVRALLSGPQIHSASAKRDLSKDRTRSLLLLIGGTVGAVLLFIGVFSTPPKSSFQESRSQAGPNLGRPAVSPVQQTGPQGSLTPLLSADVRSNDQSRDELRPEDISGTSSRPVGPDQSDPASVQLPPRTSSYRSIVPTPGYPERTSTPPTDAADPLAEYRTTGETGAPTYRYGGRLASDPVPQASTTFNYGGSGVPGGGQVRAASSTRSSIVFVRDGKSLPALVSRASAPTTPPNDEGHLLPPGTRLIARVDAAATSALQAPVIASIEYNYERYGSIVVPAGSKVIGEIRQVSADGYVSVRFHTLQMPDGRDMPIEATAMSLDLKPLKGEVSGKNTGKRVLSRTLSGIGTIAAYVVGEGGGLSSGITGETLLRDRVASNIALAGEEQLRAAAYSQNITVTLAANTRLYVVLQKQAASTSVARISETSETRAQTELPTIQELRELMDLRREINRMYQESNDSSSGALQ